MLYTVPLWAAFATLDRTCDKIRFIEELLVVPLSYLAFL